MPRKGAVPKRDVLPDPVYGNKDRYPFHQQSYA